ncbi:MAG: hypothetical protein SVE93_06500 [Candidatus Thermoplasmatota archaeon]|nr:hypothetical protein [Candidatus Thermoplasmatota archaeon]
MRKVNVTSLALARSYTTAWNAVYRPSLSSSIFQLADRLSFQHFISSTEISELSTIWRFRESLSPQRTQKLQKQACRVANKE